MCVEAQREFKFLIVEANSNSNDDLNFNNVVQAGKWAAIKKNHLNDLTYQRFKIRLR